MTRYRSTALLVVVVVCWGLLPAGHLAAKEPALVFLVRHAEKVDESPDAKLSAAGKQRAQRLAEFLRDAQLDRIHSTDFTRTRDTAAGVAAAQRKRVEIYNRYNPRDLIKQIQAQGGRHLIVGHRSTLPGTVQLLGGKPGPRFHPTEFDRLYLLVIQPDGEVSTVIIRYGKPFQKLPAQ